jgi:hypothetical protein
MMRAMASITGSRSVIAKRERRKSRLCFMKSANLLATGGFDIAGIL